MNLKNKLLSASLAACMVVPMAMPVCAEGDEKGTTLKYVVNESYEWSIHTAIDFGEDQGINKTDVAGNVTDGSEQKVKVTKNVIEEGQKLHIIAKGSGTDGKFSVKNGEAGTEVLGYTVQSGTNTVDVNGTVLDVSAGTNEGSADMKFTLSTTTKAAEVAGTYTGTITYTASIVPQQ